MRVVTLSFLLIVSLFGANVTDAFFSQDESGAFNLTLQVNGAFNASYEQKHDGSVTALIFKGLRSDISFKKTPNSSMIETVSVKQGDKNSTQVSFVSKQLFDTSVTAAVGALHISLIPKTAPLMIEDIAKDTASGNVVGYVLDTLLYVALGLFAVTLVFILFLKLKLFGRAKRKSVKPQSEEEPQPPTQDEPTAKVETAPKEEAAPPVPKPPKSTPPKKPAKKSQKSLFDI
ncbi:MAG: hypothetical protein LBQ18_08070 [Campylobacteraceae bacterium]|jgi:hypothetical protein|nr:hypothetical protein [Campylobacteraceae bacterium]